MKGGRNVSVRLESRNADKLCNVQRVIFYHFVCLYFFRGLIK